MLLNTTRRPLGLNCTPDSRGQGILFVECTDKAEDEEEPEAVRIKGPPLPGEELEVDSGVLKT